MPWIPKQQGDLDGACGFYAIVNALMLVTDQNLGDEDLRNVVSLHRKADVDVVPWDVFDGMSRHDLNWTLSEAVVLYSEGEEHDIVIKRPFWNKRPGLAKFWADVEKHLSCPNRAVITAFHRDFKNDDVRSHWTVISAASSKMLSLHDSGGSQRILRKHSRMETKEHFPNLKRPYAFEASSTFLLSLK